MADGPITTETLKELVTRRDILAILQREPATSRQIAHALRSVGAIVDVGGLGVTLGYMRRDGLVEGRTVAYGGARGLVTEWRLTTQRRGPRRQLRMVAHAHRPMREMHRHDCAHETDCVAQVADLEPSSASCECPAGCPHLVPVPPHVRVALAQPRGSWFELGGDEQ